MLGFSLRAIPSLSFAPKIQSILLTLAEWCELHVQVHQSATPDRATFRVIRGGKAPVAQMGFPGATKETRKDRGRGGGLSARNGVAERFEALGGGEEPSRSTIGAHGGARRMSTRPLPIRRVVLSCQYQGLWTGSITSPANQGRATCRLCKLLDRSSDCEHPTVLCAKVDGAINCLLPNELWAFRLLQCFPQWSVYFDLYTCCFEMLLDFSER